MDMQDHELIIFAGLPGAGPVIRDLLPDIERAHLGFQASLWYLDDQGQRINATYRVHLPHAHGAVVASGAQVLARGTHLQRNNRPTN